MISRGGIENVPGSIFCVASMIVLLQNLGYTVRRLMATGLVRHYRAEEHSRHYLLMLNREMPWVTQVRELL